ncbi:unnamed protein product [Urochloa decumbens]|uniref:F-box domain-containing protein n=1 Tax=Urochloa decumbens TaxID=240449 RepID=A0ABC8V8Y9_9POAL
MAETTGPSWSDIPLDLAGRILRRLPDHIDRIRFSAVCPQWRAAARRPPVHPPLPLLLLPDATAYSLPGGEPFHFAGCEGYTDACGNWLVFLGDDACFLRDPFTNATVTLPALSRRRVQHVGGEFLGEEMEKLDEATERLDKCKIIRCSPHLIAAIFILSGGDMVGMDAIAVCQPGANSWWSVRADHQVPFLVDIVYHQGKLYAFDMDALFVVDISTDHSTGDPWVSQIQQVIGGLPTPIKDLMASYLVESCGVLLLVCRKRGYIIRWGTEEQGDVIQLASEQDRFEVFEANFGQSRWAKVTTLGDDQVLFLRRRCCRSVCVSHDEVPGDCIFFLDKEYDPFYPCEGVSCSCKVYSMRDGKVSTESTLLPTVSWEQDMVWATWLLPSELK